MVASGYSFASSSGARLHLPVGVGELLENLVARAKLVLPELLILGSDCFCHTAG
jgi:hypothetical protein